jgi:hypothetical protein
MIETLPQSFSKIDFANRTHLLHYNYNPRKSTGKQVGGKGKQVDDDDDDDDNDQDEDGKRTRNPDGGNTALIKFSDPIPFSHPLGRFPPRWTNYKPSYRGFKLNQRINQLFEIYPSMY